jgi:hypothetical protein
LITGATIGVVSRGVAVLKRDSSTVIVELSVRPIVPLVDDPEVVGAGNTTDVPTLEIESAVIQIHDVLLASVIASLLIVREPVIARARSGLIKLSTNGDLTVITDPIVNLGNVMEAGFRIRDGRIPVIPGVLVVLSPPVRIVSGNLATVLIIVVLIEASSWVADKVLPSVLGLLNGVKTRAKDFSGAGMNEADVQKEVVVLVLLGEVVGVKTQALRLEARSPVSTGEDTAVNAVLTARGRNVVALLATSSSATARTREISLATVGRRYARFSWKNFHYYALPEGSAQLFRQLM